tara:strand:- start:1127 stop:1447 length:321 start_codon:yes stop_codon:yes gene_type:complete
MKLGISIKIDVTKIDKSRLFSGAKGTYLDLTTFIDTDNAGQYGDHGFISQSVSKEERDAKVQAPILGNCKVFYNDNAASGPAPHQQARETMASDQTQPFEDSDIPF